jgi:uncharacterized membrane protein YkvA (DUF1232 family)
MRKYYLLPLRESRTPGLRLIKSYLHTRAAIHYNILMQRWLGRLKTWAERLEKEVVAIYYAYRDPRTPWYVRLFCGFIVLMTLSPIDLIPDFIPIFGYLDDALFLPLSIWLALKLIPKEVMDDSRQKATELQPSQLVDKRKSILLIVSIWMTFLVILSWVLYLIFWRK